MMKTYHSKIIFKAPFNDLSFGQVSYNLAKAMYNIGLNVSIFPIGGTINLTAYDKIDSNFFEWFKKSISERYSGISKDTPTIQLWHLRDSDSAPTSKSYLFTFHEILGVTDTEKAICSLHDKVIFSSKFSKDNFTSAGLTNCYNIPIGFDDEIDIKNKEYLKDVAHYGLIGKFESRKNTELIIKTWLSLYGNNKDYRLTCLVDNPFFNKDTMAQLIANCYSGKDYFNITFLPRLKTNSEISDLYNSIDIDLSGLSSAEGWNLPAFNATALGKWSCVLNHTSHMDWATSRNSLLLEPSGLKDAYDEAFFRKGDAFNQGKIYVLQEDSLKEILLKSSSYVKKPNFEGEKLRIEFTYDKTLKSILEIINT